MTYREEIKNRQTKANQLQEGTNQILDQAKQEVEKMKFQISKNIILTGAGFTHTFGAPLAKQMWAEIFNDKHIQDSPRLKKLMLSKFNYEQIYTSVEKGKYSSQEKEIMRNAIQSAYKNLDDTIKENTSIYSMMTLKIFNFIDYFAGDKGEKCFIFTLNQDLLLERKFTGGASFLIPGIENYNYWFKGVTNKDLDNSFSCKLPTEEELTKKKEEHLSNDANMFYIKLHGSYKWTSYDGSNALVVGIDKESEIQKEPLLKWYFELFKQVINQNEAKLLVIGYGFGDMHINKVIIDAIKSKKLKLYVVSPESPEEFKYKLTKLGRKSIRLWDDLAGYFPHPLNVVFSGSYSNERTYVENSIYNAIF